MLSIVTTCKSRLHHLQHTLPLMLRQSFAEVVVVDYGCGQGTADWVVKNHPQARVVKVDDDPGFCLARARNIGAANSSHPFLCFADADTIFKGDVGGWFRRNARESTLYRCADKVDELDGFAICSKANFRRVGGYDEAIRGWGHEDTDLYERLGMIGVARSTVPEGALDSIRHGNEERQFGKNDPGGYQSRREASALGEAYRLIKMDAMKLLGMELAPEFRKKLFEQILTLHGEARNNGRDVFFIHVDLPFQDGRNVYSKASRRLSYVVPVQPLVAE
ncbi:glycosyltransferase [Parvibaculum sedimenti]|uniref:Glycosyltransferase n=1 Tax=Parvibaculum sedimenti TaxID=2608632 RepID=A0A6N6VNA7_9HYPH|nr:glycosyltransferase family A protein [Parvibaculum sedimenti]KAB7740564.1 glycosyltransferase [Parvibaculum sedimenti]